MKRNLLTKISSAVLSASIGLSFVAVTGNNIIVRADGNKNTDNTTLGISIISNPEKPEDLTSPWVGSYVYFGNYDGNPIKFRVLDSDTDKYGSDTMLLDCNDILFRAPLYDDLPWRYFYSGVDRDPVAAQQLVEKCANMSAWKNSKLRKDLNGEGFLDKEGTFTGAEKAAIAKSTIETHDLVIGTDGAGQVDYRAAKKYVLSIGLDGDQVFLLDIEDILNEDYGYLLPRNYEIMEYGAKGETCSFLCKNRVKADDCGYWLRSMEYYSSIEVPAVYSDGSIYDDLVTCDVLGVSPALNISQSSVLFTTCVAGTKGETGAEYKLTFIDPDLELALSSSAYYSGNTITVPFSISGKDPSEVSQISVLITDKEYTDKDAEILYYDSLNVTGNISSSGTGTFTLPEDLNDLGSGYHLYVFAEDINGDHESDSASKPSEILNIIPASEAETDTNTNTDNNNGQDQTPINPAPKAPEKKSFGEFVDRLYEVALGRESESEGKAFWVDQVQSGKLTGADCAREFLNSAEFNDRNLSDEEFVKVLYQTFFNRDAEEDISGYQYWLNELKTQGRKDVIDGFIDSTEWCNVCASYGVRSGAATAKATKASDNATAFATRLYTECLGREPEQEGLNFWSLALTNLEVTGTKAAREFFYSQEFIDGNYDNEEYLNRLYLTFMGREPDSNGLNYWLDLLDNDVSRDSIFDSFSTSDEFKAICSDYAILE